MASVFCYSSHSTLESLLKGFSHYVQSVLPGGLAVAMGVYLVFDFAVIVLLFAMIFKFSCLMPRLSGEMFLSAHS